MRDGVAPPTLNLDSPSRESVIDRVAQLRQSAAHAKQAIRDKLIDHKRYIAVHGEDMPEIRNWKWPY